jgi:LytS/YehU family sensor histidine kinase
MTGLGALALIHGWLATFIYVRLRNSRRATKALADAEIERTEAQRSLLAAQLVAAHAQVDPAFVLQALERVERAYEEDPGHADALLDEFISFLRDAIPRLRAEDVLEAT